MTLSPLIIGLIIFAVLAGGAFVGWETRQRLPAHHLNDETKSLVSVSMAVVGTISALVLGLLISNANTSFIARNGEVTMLSADILRLDQMLRLYGPEANPARGKLLQFAERKANDLFPESLKDVHVDNESTYEVLKQVEYLMLELRPPDPRVNGFYSRRYCMPQRSVIRTGFWAKRLGRALQRRSLLSSCSGCPCCSPVLGCLRHAI